MSNLKFFVLFLLFFQINCANQNAGVQTVDENDSEQAQVGDAAPAELETSHEQASIQVGAERTSEYLQLLAGQKVALVVNQTSMIGDTHLADSLLSLGIQIEKIFAPEHGFRGTADAGEHVKDGIDLRTGLPLLSLHGKTKKPSAADLAGIDWVVFDIQDVGARFYTYISTMHYVMESCAENDVKFMVLDRPNPNGNYIDGPVLDPDFQSFVGMHPVPVIHGMTIAEYARMINGEGWLKGGQQTYLHFVTCANYSHSLPYELPIKPSPNLPNQRSIYLYPSLCFFEGTTVSAGRGTEKQFQVYGHPESGVGDYTFTPIARPGAKYPKFKNEECSGFDLTHLSPGDLHQKQQLDLSYFINFYQSFQRSHTGDLPPGKFFLKNNFFDKLAGTDRLRKAILAGQTEAEIRASWGKELADYQKVREKYLLYGE
ncbi:MAG: exo-beta-N-acetylmuramidase NamZ domain-containing protein [Saprospiraceae bacterium]